VFTLSATASCKATGTVSLARKKLATFSKQLHAGTNKITVKLNKNALKALTKALKHKRTLSLRLRVKLNGTSSGTHTLKLTR
jgi:hypothetical protein